ncbi:MAG TPA: hypothetical protein DD415_03565 [Clostridiales bacterium]|nr:hypothetical protein [Clostridiales bacterium]
MRAAARETLFKIIFASQFTGEVNCGFKNALYKAEKVADKDAEYCDRILSVIAKHADEFTAMLDSRSKLFPEARMFPADRSILLLSMAEILYCEDIPDAVSANEAANIASKYSSEKSASFVSGILADLIKDKKNV